MNDRLPNQSTLPLNQPVLPDPWVERIFDHMAALYGSKFADLWRGTDAEKVKDMWARKLGGFASMPACIRAALNALDERPFPPTLPEFIQLCRESARRFGNGSATHPRHPSPEERERAKAAASEAARIARGDGRDHLAWTRNPVSQYACTAVFEGAQRDARLKAIRDELIRSGVSSEAGKLLRPER